MKVTANLEEGRVPVSAILPCFRCSATIDRAVKSIAHQTKKPAEIILIDDASGDDTLPKLLELERKYPGWVKVLPLEENKGAASARNAGWAVASQPYIAFLDADDAWHPKKIEIQYAYMNTHPNTLLCGHKHKVIKQNDAFPDWEVGSWKEERINKWALLLSNKFITPSAMVRREIKYRFVERQRYMEDHMLWLMLVCHGERVVKLSAELAAIYKKPFGVAGLSAQVWFMERGDLGNYRRLYRARCINRFQFSLLGIYSLLKYFRRLLIFWTFLRWRR